MTSLASSNPQEKTHDFPFQFMIDARKTANNWAEQPSSGGPSGILSPFQWSPPQPPNPSERLTGDITAFYHGPNCFQNDDSFSFFDQSFFFMDHLELTEPTPHPTKPPVDSQQRVSFASRLTKCHRQRMSTISEFPVYEDTSTEEEDDDNSSQKAEVSVGSQERQPEFPQNLGLKKLLDYVVPYPTRRVKRHVAKQKRRESEAARKFTRSPSVKTTTSTSSSESECISPDDEDWITHGFFEIVKGH